MHTLFRQNDWSERSTYLFVLDANIFGTEFLYSPFILKSPPNILTFFFLFSFSAKYLTKKKKKLYAAWMCAIEFAAGFIVVDSGFSSSSSYCLAWHCNLQTTIQLSIHEILLQRFNSLAWILNVSANCIICQISSEYVLCVCVCRQHIYILKKKLIVFSQETPLYLLRYI